MTEMNHDLLDWVKSEGDNLGFKDITSAVKPVSYTHLTLPTTEAV